MVGIGVRLERYNGEQASNWRVEGTPRLTIQFGYRIGSFVSFPFNLHIMPGLSGFLQIRQSIERSKIPLHAIPKHRTNPRP